MSKIIKIVGPPGTGKTTKIISLLQEAALRYPIESIGGVSFTNAAVESLVKKVKEVSGIPEHISGKIQIKTLHAHCFELLGLTVDRIADKKIKEFNEAYPDYALYFTQIVEDEEDKHFENIKNIENYRLFREMQIFRNKRLKQSDWPIEVREFYEVWDGWVQSKDYYDFTGLLETILDIDRCIAASVLFVDECQDLTRLQLDIILNWARNIEETYLVGDSDQAIYRFAGGQPEVFRDIRYDEKIVLSQSYRVPPAIHAYALKILEGIKDREEAEYLPYTGGVNGQVIQILEPDLSLDGSHMIICRCQFRVYFWMNWLEERGLLWNNPYRPEDLSWNPEATEEWKALAAYREFLGEGELPVKQFKAMIKVARQIGNMQRGTKKRVEEMQNSSDLVTLDTIADLGFFASFLDESRSIDEIFNLKSKAGKIAWKYLQGEAKKPIIVGTIHSVKGGEADHVWIDLKRTKKILNAMKLSETARFDEMRIKYVAVTRARKTVGMVK